MFLCIDCSKDKTGFQWRLKSHGPCENCHYTRICIDVKGAEIDPNWQKNLAETIRESEERHK